jgi:hypothetical protein
MKLLLEQTNSLAVYLKAENLGILAAILLMEANLN